MVEVTYIRRPLEGKMAFKVKGHAGNDEVCAAASMLAYTAAASLEQWADGILDDKTIQFEAGNAVVAVKFDSKYRESILIQFDTLAAGFDLLAGNFPDKAEFEVIDK